MSDARLLRDRQIDASSTLDRSPGATRDCAAAMVLQTFTLTTYPTTAANFYATHPVVVTGSEDEGATPTFTADTDTTVYALNCGSTIPPTGTNICAHLVGGRFTFRFDG